LKAFLSMAFRILQLENREPTQSSLLRKFNAHSFNNIFSTIHIHCSIAFYSVVPLFLVLEAFILKFQPKCRHISKELVWIVWMKITFYLLRLVNAIFIFAFYVMMLLGFFLFY